MSKRDEQIARIQGLMTYGISNAPKKTPVTESIEGPDGKIYAIIREGAKFYIKSAAKGSELVAESFNYIGGFMNKKNNEYSSYNQASKNLELKVRSLNEAYGVNKTVELLNPEKKETLMVEMTDSMKASLARYRQIMNNAAGIMNESSNISQSNTGVPEAPKTTGFSPKLGEPFNDEAKAELDKDLKATANDPEKQGEPFGDNSKAEEYKDAQYVPSGSVANQHPSGGKVVRVNENEEYEETIEECEEWGSCGVPEVGGVGEIGDDDPFTETVNEDSPVGFADEDTFDEGEDEINLDDIDSPLGDEDTVDDINIDDIDSEEEGVEGIEGSEESEEVEEESEIDALRKEVEELRELVNSLKGEEGFEDDETSFNEDEYEDEEGPEFMQESVNLPFPVKPRMDELSNVKSSFHLAKDLKNIMEQQGVGNENDVKIVTAIRGKLMQIIQCHYELDACRKNEYLEDDDTWIEIISTMESEANKVNRLVNGLSFINSLDNVTRKLINTRVSRLFARVEKWSQFYDEYVNPDAQVEPEQDEEEYPETPDVDPDNIGFEDDVRPTEDEIDADAWAHAEDYNSMDDMFDSVSPRKLNEEGTKLNVFGKHPGYRKKVMSLPQTGSDEEGNVRDWNDESVYSEEPFGAKIGSSAPFEDTINKTVDAIMESLKKKL